MFFVQMFKTSLKMRFFSNNSVKIIIFVKIKKLNNARLQIIDHKFKHQECLIHLLPNKISLLTKLSISIFMLGKTKTSSLTAALRAGSTGWTTLLLMVDPTRSKVQIPNRPV